MPAKINTNKVNAYVVSRLRKFQMFVNQRLFVWLGIDDYAKDVLKSRKYKNIF